MSETIGVIGAGRMGSGIAQVFAQAGYNVILLDVTSKFLLNARQTISASLDKEIEAGKLAVADKASILGRLTTGTDFSLLSQCRLCIESVLENDGIKSFLHTKIREKAGPHVIIASNTASLSVAALGHKLDHAGKFLGLAFGFPPQTTPDVKIIPGPHTSRETIDIVTQHIAALGKKPVMTSDRKKPFRLSLTLQTWAFFTFLALMFVLCGFSILSSSTDSSGSSYFLLAAIGGFLGTCVFSFRLLAQFRHVLALNKAMTGLAANDLASVIPFLDRDDECGDMARTVDILKKITIEVDRLAEEEAKKTQNDAERRRKLEQLTLTFEQNVGQIVDGLALEANQLQSNAKHLSEMADQTNQQASTVAAASEEASASVQTVASAAEELSASISEINRQVTESSRVSLEAVAEVKRTNTTVSTLSEAAMQIGDVVKLIQDIAEQTNLLALNATIEAARAGEAGKGFAVVASEVKNLANQTARATEEISTKIVTVQHVSTEAADAIRSIGTTIEKINQISGTIAEAIEQQTAATKEISNNVQQAYAGISEVSNSIINVTHAAKESNGASREVLQASEGLSEHAVHLRNDVKTFLTNVKQV